MFDDLHQDMTIIYIWYTTTNSYCDLCRYTYLLPFYKKTYKQISRDTRYKHREIFQINAGTQEVFNNDIDENCDGIIEIDENCDASI